MTDRTTSWRKALEFNNIRSDDRTARDDSVSEFTQVDSASEDDDYEVSYEYWFESDPDSDEPLVGIETNPGWDRGNNMFDALNTLNEFEDGEGKNYEHDGKWSQVIGIPVVGKSRHSNPKKVDEPFAIGGPEYEAYRNQSRKSFNANGKPTCTRCGRIGHSAGQCNIDKLICNLCGKPGHKARFCKTKRQWQVKANRSGAELKEQLKDMTDREAGTRDALREAIDEKREIENDLGRQTGDDAYYRAKEEAVMAKKAAENAEALQREQERVSWVQRKAAKLNFEFDQFVPYLDWRKIVLAVLAGAILFFLLFSILAGQTLICKVSPWITLVPLGGALAASLLTVVRNAFSSGIVWTQKKLYSKYKVHFKYNISKILNEEHEDDRPESHRAKDMLYVNPIYAKYLITKTTYLPYVPIFSDNSFEEVRIDEAERKISIEAFMQMCNPKIMPAGRDTDLVFESLNQQAASMHFVNFSRGNTLKKENILQNTVDFAHGYAISQSQEREVTAPFLSRLLN